MAWGPLGSQALDVFTSGYEPPDPQAVEGPRDPCISQTVLAGRVLSGVPLGVCSALGAGPTAAQVSATRGMRDTTVCL